MALVVLAWLLLAGVVVQVGRLVAGWRRGGAARVDWVSGVMALPRRYLVDVHAVVARRREASVMHQMVAGGLLAGTLLLLLGVVPGVVHARLYRAVTAVAFAVALVGAALVRRRRVPVRPSWLSGGGFLRLPVYLGAYALGGLVGTLASGPLGVIGVAVAAFGGVGLVAQIGDGPMRHALAGALHLVAHPRPGRFAGEMASGLVAIDLAAERLGVGAIGDFGWNRLVGFDACIQCGRCEEACPAFAAGQPLNPKALIQDFCAALRPGAAEYAGSPHPGIVSSGPVLGVLHAQTLWSCTTCRACVAACPMMIEHVDAVVDVRRHLTLESGAAPGKAATVLGALRYVGNVGGVDPGRRLDFAAGLKLRVLAPGDAVDVLLWLGDGAFERRYEATLIALIGIMRAAGVEFAVLGAAEQDCGDVARRLGDEAGFARLAVANVALLGSVRFARIVTADPHALQVLRWEYPAFGGVYTVVHHTALIDELITRGRIALAPPGDAPITYHDPCYLARYNGETEAPRRVLARLTGRAVEMARAGQNSFCCGGGGGAPVTDIPGARRIPDMRMDQARQTGAAVVAVACPGCTAMLEGVVGPRPAVRDIAELVFEAMVPAARLAVA